MKIQLSHSFEDIISVDNLLLAWQGFIRGKRNKKDVQEFSFRLMDNILLLRDDLVNFNYKHGSYQAFKICDPKLRDIHKASVRDRLVHHAIYRILYPFFNRIFISDSFSCRLEKGTHKAINRFRSFVYKVSENNTKTCWILKCDIRKFFANIDHKILIRVLQEYMPDRGTLWLLREVINSFYSTKPGIGLPLGNLTSQLFVNIYMNEFDQFVKHKLKVRYYIRYADDFVIFSQDHQWLEEKIPQIQDFLENRLKLKLHPNKVSIKTLNSGEDFLGWVNFPDHRVLRTTTKRRMFRKIKTNSTSETLNSYLGLLKHGNTERIKKEISRS
ncbi:reverse transcriptase/maturase family protein [Patescibacteria group bacterium]|nr:reverse transcriptase/maturase family protein [Patescibacteria group bacterium]